MIIIFMRIYCAVVIYMIANFVTILVNDIRSRKKKKLSVAAALEEMIQEHLKMTPGYTRLNELLTRIWAAGIGLFCTIPVLIKYKVQRYRNNTVRY